MHYPRFLFLVRSYFFHLSFSKIRKKYIYHLRGWNMIYPLEVMYLNENQMKLRWLL